jgi:hypothetical protein
VVCVSASHHGIVNDIFRLKGVISVSYLWASLPISVGFMAALIFLGVKTSNYDFNLGLLIVVVAGFFALSRVVQLDQDIVQGNKLESAKEVSEKG